MYSAVPIQKTPMTVSSSLPTHQDIFKALGKKWGLTPRASQLELARLTSATLSSGGVACIEAPTGTGKTLGYLAGALEAQAYSGDPKPVVVSTATVGLQSQIMVHDIPRLAEIGVVDPRKVVVAKGRGRYFCPRTTEMLEDKEMQDSQLDMFDEGKVVAQKGVKISLDMLHAWREKKWDGDRDSWTSELPDCWDDYCGASGETCVNRACEYVDECPYMLSRTRLSQAQLVIANHDIVLADLSSRAEESPSHVIPASSYTLIVDEAHNLPEKAIDMQRARADFSSLDWIQDLGPYSEAALTVPAIAEALSKIPDVSPDALTVGAATLVSQLESFHENLKESLSFDLSGVHSWGLNSVEAKYTSQAQMIATSLVSINKALERAAKGFADRAQNTIGAEKGFSVKMLAETHSILRKAKALYKGVYLFSLGEGLVKWAQLNPNSGGVQLNSQPMEGSEVLNELLWDANIPVVMVSATLQIAGSFDRFAEKAGMPEDALTRALPPVFDYSRGLLHTPGMDFEPGQAGYEAEVVDMIERLYARNIGPGMLILFTSRETMNRVSKALRGEIKDKLLVQGSAAVPELISKHRANIDKGERSVLLGLNSMSEGLDLPGKYCSHLVVARMPFNVPGHPVEAARRELMGSGPWFEKAYLSDMLTALIQSCGRLIRRESDHGVITILDKRILTKSYSIKAIKALPGFSQSRRLLDYFDMAKEKGFDLTHGEASKKPDLKVVHSQPSIKIEPSSKGAAKPVFTVVSNTSAPWAPSPSDILLPLSKEDAPEGLPSFLEDTPPWDPSPTDIYLHDDVVEMLDDEEQILAPVKVEAVPKEPSKTRGAWRDESKASVESPKVIMEGLIGALSVSKDFKSCNSVKPLGSVYETLASVMPCDSSVFEDHDNSYLVEDSFNPGLPLGTPVSDWAARALPQAVMLGVLLQNRPSWDLSEQKWKQLLRLRPDLIQFVDVLRSHLNKELTPLAKEIEEDTCWRAISQGLAGYGMPDMSEIISFVETLEKEASLLLEGDFKLPSKDSLSLVCSTSVPLAASLRVN